MVARFPVKTIAAGSILHHLSRVSYRGTPLYFGSSGNNRYDDSVRAFGVLYLAFDLPTALMETIFHKHKWIHSRPAITKSEADQRLMRIVGVLADLRLADLSAPNFMASGLRMNLHQLTSRDYRRTQKIATQIHAEVSADKQLFDGLIYPSRNNYPALCVALFERAKAKVGIADDIDLPHHAQWPAFLRDYDIAVLPK